MMWAMIDAVYNEDCLEGMTRIPNGSVDMILTDLPYGVLRDTIWDNKIPLEPLWAEYKRVCKPNAAICLFAQMPFGAELIMSNREMFRYEWIWQKNCVGGFLNAHKAPLRVHENILIFYSELPTYNPQFTFTTIKNRKPGAKNKLKTKAFCIRGKKSDSYAYIDTGRRFPVDVQKFARDSGGKRIHNTQKPLALCEYLIRTYTNPGEVVLDSCIGSGTTIVAAINTGRHYIGYELSPDIYSIAAERIQRVKDTPRLFYE